MSGRGSRLVSESIPEPRGKRTWYGPFTPTLTPVGGARECEKSARTGEGAHHRPELQGAVVEGEEGGGAGAGSNSMVGPEAPPNQS